MVLKPSSLFVAALCSLVFALGCAKEPESTNTTGNNPPTTSNEGANSGDQGKMATADFAKDVKPTLESFCTPCHAGPTPKKDVDVTKLTGSEKAVLAKMASEVEAGQMPPAKAKQLPEDVKTKLVADLKALSS